MRHGRKSRSGCRRLQAARLRDLDTGLIPAVGITQANAPEASVTDDITADLEAAGWRLAELHIDRPTCPRRWSATAAPAWRSSARRGRSATPAAGRQGPISIDFAARQRPAGQGEHPSSPARPAVPQGHRAACPRGSGHCQQQRAQRRHPSRRGAAGRAAPAPADPKDAQSCANASRRARAAHVGTGRAAAPATSAPARTCRPRRPPSFTTSTSPPQPHQPHPPAGAAAHSGDGCTDMTTTMPAACPSQDHPQRMNLCQRPTLSKPDRCRSTA